MPDIFQRTDQRFPDRSLREILANLRPLVHALAPQDSVARALQLMAQHDVGLLVVLEGVSLVGVLSERDIVRQAGRPRDVYVPDLKVSELMTRDVATVGLDAPFAQCMALMEERGARHLPVVEGGRVIAIVSVRDLLREALSQHRRVLAQVDSERLAAFQSTY